MCDACGFGEENGIYNISPREEISCEGVGILELEKQGPRIAELLKGLSIESCYRNKSTELIIQFSNGARMFIDSSEPIEISITGVDDD